MKTIGYIIQKEFKQIFRNKGMLPIIFVLPILQLIILSNAATYEIDNISMSYIDHDRSSSSRALIQKFEASSYFNVEHHYASQSKANQALLRGETDIILEIPLNFEKKLGKGFKTDLGVTINEIGRAHV